MLLIRNCHNIPQDYYSSTLRYHMEAIWMKIKRILLEQKMVLVIVGWEIIDKTFYLWLKISQICRLYVALWSNWFIIRCMSPQMKFLQLTDFMKTSDLKKKWSFIASKISLKCFSLVDYKIDLFLGSITMMLSEKEEFVISTQVQFYHFHSCKKWVCFMRYIYTRLYIIGNKELLSTKMKNIYGINQDAIFIYVNIDWKMFYVCVIT